MWKLTDHACSLCFGRVLERASQGPGPRYRCAECGHTAEAAVEAMCCCGVKVGSKSGLECVKNPARSAHAPQEVVVRERAAKARDVRVQGKVAASNALFENN
jgi:hypothetical protein